MKAPAFMKSIRWRLLVWIAFLLICVLGAFGFTAYQLHVANQLQQVDQELQERLALLSGALGGPPRGPGRPPPTAGPGRKADFPPPRAPFREPPPERREVLLPEEAQWLFAETNNNGFYFVIWSRNGTELKRSTNTPAGLGMPAQFGRDTTTQVRERDTFREAFQFNGRGDCILAGISLTPLQSETRELVLRLSLAATAVLFLGMGGAWLLATRALAPVGEISRTANRIAAGNLAERIVASDQASELGRLAGILNSTFARLETAFVQQKQFTADASHELRTPLAVIISEAQTALMRERSASDYRQALQGTLEAAQQMRKLADSLLELARLDAGDELLERAPVDLVEIIRERVEMLRPLAEARRLKVMLDLQETRVNGDATRLGQVVTNLVTNAIVYNRDAGEISVHLKRRDGSSVLTVSDTGIGISAEDLPRIFERFYRADKARSRQEGRTGLGLAITKAIVLAHGGRIEVSSQPAKGTTFVVVLPSP
jgi:two-component system, OmpR family, sensor kinase